MQRARRSESNIAQVLPGAGDGIRLEPLSAIICWNGDPNISGTVPFSTSLFPDCSPGSLAILPELQLHGDHHTHKPMTLTVSNDTTVRWQVNPRRWPC
ncbi:MAG: hypothetical protein IPH53_00005 [Flavobacteriales bacterium]|nr:hypothetical protein [Flavobacteriales bacterium]